MSEAIIGPQRCIFCGGEYGHHTDSCAALADQSHAPASRLWVSRREHEQEVARLMDLLQREREIGKMLEGLLDRRCPGWRKLQPCAGSSSSKK